VQHFISVTTARSKHVSVYNCLAILPLDSLWSWVIDCDVNKGERQQKEIKMNTRFQSENLKGSGRLWDISGRIILKCILKICCMRLWNTATLLVVGCIGGFLWGRQISYALKSRILRFINDGNLLHQLNKCHIITEKAVRVSTSYFEGTDASWQNIIG
jgi:hypothetical protein